MRRLFTMAALVALTFSNAFAEKIITGKQASKEIPGAEVIRYKDFTSIPNYIQFRTGKTIAFSNWQEWVHSKYFKNTPEVGFELIGTETDKLGMVHYRYQQTLNGVPITFGVWLVHTKNNEVLSMNGELFDSIPTSTPGISADQALTYALDYIDADVYKWEVEAEEAILKMEENDPTATYYPEGELQIVNKDIMLQELDLKLAWKFNVYAHNPMSRREIYVDAQNGNIILESDLIHHADSNGVANTGYSGTQNIVADYTGTNFRLRESGRGNGVETYDMNNGTNYGGASDFFDNDNLWTSTAVDQYATDAHWGAEMTYDFYWNNFNRNSINNNGFTLRSYVHYDQNYANAFWDGQRMTYGDGSNGNAPFTALDIAGHEVTHGLTTFTANLVYQDEPGALNESFSDIFGAAIEFEALGVNNGDWLMGEDLGFVIRYMNNPNQGGDPDTYHGTNWYFGAQDNGGVHTNSGVQNFWYYLLVTGGSGVNDNGDSYNVTALGLTDANAIAYRNLTTYLTVTSQYADARFYALQSAIDLYGPCSQQVISTGMAWYAVGVGTPYQSTVVADFDAEISESCQAPFTVQFDNYSSNATSYSWNFGDGNTSTQANPTHTYTSNGNYTVTLNVSSTCGTDVESIVDMVKIGPSIPCETIMPENGQGPAQTQCSGVLYDHGGPSGNYNDNTDSEITIAPNGALNVTINFDQFDVEDGGGTCIYDYLEVYDGPNTTGSLVGKFCNSNPPPTSLTSSTDAFTLVFHSDGGLNEAGFKISWVCGAPTEAPVVDFTVNTTENCNGNFEFTDISSNGPTSWVWEFGDGDTSHAEHPSHTYAASGTYNVKLTAANAIGSGTLTKTGFVTVSKPAAPGGSDVQVCPGNIATLVAIANSDVYWYDAQIGGNLLHVGDTFVTPTINTSTPYYAETLEEGSIQNVGPTSNNIGSGGNFNSNQHQIFDVYKKMILDSVRVYANGAGVREIELRDANGNSIAIESVYMVNGEQMVAVGFEIDPGIDYQLGISNNSQANMYRNNNGPTYPYTLNGICSITRSSANTDPYGYYYFYYDWKVRELCKSERATISASTGECTGINEIEQANFKLYPNPNNGAFTIANEVAEQSEYIITDAKGQLITSFKTDEQTIQLNLELSAGVYLISKKSATKNTTQRLIVK